MKHLRIGGSTISRTLACPGWLKLSENIPTPKSGFSADLGNLLHDAMEEHLKRDTPFKDMVGKLTFADQVLEEEHIEEHLNPMTVAVNELLDEHDIDRLLLEPFVQLVKDEQGGSIDVLGISYDCKTLLIADYKTGTRWVSPSSKQLRFYALCALKDPSTKHMLTSVEKVVCAIIQPAQSDKAIQATYTVSEVLALEGEIKDALSTPDKVEPGWYCLYCPAAPVCPKRLAQARSALMLSPETAAEIAEALTLANDLENWIKQVKEQAYNIANDGGVLPGYKLVEGRSVRRWKKGAEDVLTAKLGDKAYEHKLIGITKAEKLLGRGSLEELDLTEKPEGKPALVPEERAGAEVYKTVPDSLKNLVDKSLNK